MKNFKIYKSSAGSGKTYTLALEFLKIALQSENAYSNILAVTFTNKATREMKDRIISFLDQIVKGNSADLSTTLQTSLSINKETLRSRAQNLKTSLLHGYSSFSVFTIDTFFQKVIRAFAREMGLQAGFNLELDTSKVLDDIIDQIFIQVNEDKALTQWLVQFASSKVESGKSWDFREDLKKLGMELFKEDFKINIEPYLYHEGFRDRIKKILKHCQEIRNSFENSMANEGKAAIALMEQYGLSINNFSYKEQGVAGYLYKIATKKSFSPGSRPLNALDNPDQWYKKKDPLKDKIHEAINNGLNDYLRNSLTIYETRSGAYFTAIEVLKNIYTYGLFNYLLGQLDQYRQEHDVMLISDAPVFLHGIIDQEETPFIYEKIGAQYQNFLIDEFQDTSAFQWNNFKPLIKNSIEGGHESLIVGDVKQSIYRFRGGDWRLLLDQVHQDIPESLTTTYNLDNNFRSQFNVVAFNNSFFIKAAKNIEHALQTTLQEAHLEKSQEEKIEEKISMITKAYHDVRQVPKKDTDQQGYVNISFLEDDAEASNGNTRTGWKEKAMGQIPEIIESLQDNKIPLRETAILVRRKEEGKEIADFLMEYKNSSKAKPGYDYEIVSSEALFLHNSHTISLLINALKYLDDPENQVVCANLLYDVLLVNGLDDNIFQGTNNLHQLFSTSILKEILPEKFIKNNKWLRKLPVYELTEQLIAIFNLGNYGVSSIEKAYLQAFQDQILDFSQREKGDIHSFITWWEENGKDASILIPETMEAIRILTIHKSKGLQFQTVVLPFCDWLLPPDAKKSNILWATTHQSPFKNLGPLPVKYSDSLTSTYFIDSYYDEMVKAYIDNLNLLYVALTRAISGLYVMAPLPASQDIKKVNKLLFDALNGQGSEYLSEEGGEIYPDLILNQFWNEDDKTFQLGSYPGKREEENNHDGKEDAIKITKLKGYPSFFWQSKLSIRQNAKDFFLVKSPIDSGVKEQATISKINYGLVIHDLLARIVYQDQLEEKLNEVFFERGLNHEDLHYLRKKMENLFAQESIRKWFDNSWHASQVKTEKSVLTRAGKIYRPDRVMVNQNEITILEFKTGEQDASHLNQLKNYKKLMKNMGYSNVEGYILYIEPEKLVAS